ncbi:hypothetical protein [Scytonema millei]|uniref:MHS family MFS transporter n=1 Tax=Scytonema millei VB511283 TaxID=1245923 RepID=A0A9X5E7F8_9CYAN|nr:hypothetical protein [Scytonema millei]NHC36168.1 MHS family MFS transporter [Scytonema millei VB511283]
MQQQNSSQQTIAKPLTLDDETERVRKQKERKKVANSYFLRELVQRHPKLVLLGVSAFLLFAIYSSIASIFQIGVLKEETGTPSVVTTNTSNTQPASSDNSLSSWLLGAVTLGAAIGGVAIAKRLSKSSSDLSQFFLQFHSSPQQQFPPLRESILSLSSLKLSEPKPTWVESSMETESELNIHSESDEFTILIQEDSFDDGKENYLETLELTPEEKSLIFENIVFTQRSESSPVEDISNSETESTSVPENDVYSPLGRSLAEMLDLRQQLSLATLLESSNTVRT